MVPFNSPAHPRGIGGKFGNKPIPTAQNQRKQHAVTPVKPGATKTVGITIKDGRKPGATDFKKPTKGTA